MERKSNYALTRDRLERDFLRYDQAEILRRVPLRHDGAYLYLIFLQREYRIDRTLGRVEWSDDGFRTAVHAGHDEVGTIFDYLCCARTDVPLTGEYVSVNQLDGVVAGTTLGDGMFDGWAGQFTGRTKALALACEALGGTKEPVGDVAYRLPLLGRLDLILQFWDADEEFPPALRVKWDRAVLSYLKYETTYYAVNCLWQRLKENMPEECAPGRTDR